MAAMGSKRLAVCAVFENAERLLPEWLAYHHLVGVGHFVLYDNASTDASAQAIRASPVAEHVTLIRWPQKPGRVPAYRHFIDIFAAGFEWVAFIDVDQFLVPRSSRSIMDTLNWLDSAAAVLVQRLVFAPGEWPAGRLATEAFQRRAAEGFQANALAHTIARCSELLDVAQPPDSFRINGPVFNTAGHLVPNRSVQDQPCFQNLVLHHYCPRPDPQSLAIFLDPWSEAPPPDDTIVAMLGDQPDDTMKAFAPAVRALLGLAVAGSTSHGSTPHGSTPHGSTPHGSFPQAQGGQMAGTQSEFQYPAADEQRSVGQEALSRGQSDDAAQSQGWAEVTADPRAFPPPRPPASPGLAEQPQSYAAMPPEQRPPGGAPAPVAPESRAPMQPARMEAPSPLHPTDIAPGWIQVAPDGQVRIGGLALVFRDRSRPGEHWQAALRGAVADAIDPAFLTDDYDRIRDFPTSAAARAACDAALASGRQS